MVRTAQVQVDQAVGMVISHDLTQIDVQQGYKGARFKRGHVVRQDDIPVLKSMGKNTLTIIHLEEGDVHEDEASSRLAARMAGEGIQVQGPEEGKVTLVAGWNGLAVYDEESLHTINSDESWALAAIPNKVPVKKGEPVAGIRTVPIVMSEETVARAESAALPFTVFPFHPLRTALVTTGREILEGRIRDSFAPKLVRKLAAYGSTLMEQVVVGDDRAEISGAIRALIEKNAELIIVTGGMSIDADDCTAEAILEVSDEVVFNGVPVLPGARLMLGLQQRTKIVGAPACVAHDSWTSLDILLNRLFAGLIPSREEVRRWGVGGYCRKCRACNFPICSFAAR